MRALGWALMAGAVLVVGAMLSTSALALGLAALGAGAAASQRAAGAADNAAVAAADAASGAASGAPCARAAEVAASARAEVVACELDVLEAFVVVRGTFAGLPVVARARAGPPLMSESPGRADTQ